MYLSGYGGIIRLPRMGLDSPQTLRIFIAEDHVAIREVLAAYLQTRPHLEVIGEASDGLIALDQCRKLKPDLVLLDIDLPGMNGISIARALTSTTPETHILVFSSHYDTATVRQALETGARGIIEKTSQVETLLKAIETVGAGRAYFGERVTKILQQSFSEPTSTRSSDNLTAREREVLQLIAEGCSNKDVASRLGISIKTAENHRHHLMQKLGTRNAADLTREAFRLGLVRMSSPPQG